VHITSAANEQVKHVRALQRRRTRYQERLFIAEGVRTIEEAFKAGVQPAFLFYTSAAIEQPRARALVEEASACGLRTASVSDAVMVAMSDTATPSGILAVLPMEQRAPGPHLDWVLILDRLRNPGNLGTILRSSLAAGVELVMTTTGTVDAYSPKVVRAAMGAHFPLRLSVNNPWHLIEELVRGMQVLVAQADEGVPYWDIDWRKPTALIIGGEARGPRPEAFRTATGSVTIPMTGPTESLNAAVAASVLLLEGARQRFVGGCQPMA